MRVVCRRSPSFVEPGGKRRSRRRRARGESGLAGGGRVRVAGEGLTRARVSSWATPGPAGPVWTAPGPGLAMAGALPGRRCCEPGTRKDADGGKSGWSRRGWGVWAAGSPRPEAAGRPAAGRPSPGLLCCLRLRVGGAAPEARPSKFAGRWTVAGSLPSSPTPAKAPLRCA